ncbi:hypothetical protein AB6A40_005333 [Gnathostoma spinigerum]|uniref:Uncharacterized protein n=1 Tax=Gnathostoma spinigerum TaxID=75299 RepID=A0ABD6EKD8_9BILA
MFSSLFRISISSGFDMIRKIIVALFFLIQTVNMFYMIPAPGQLFKLRHSKIASPMQRSPRSMGADAQRYPVMLDLPFLTR